VWQSYTDAHLNSSTPLSHSPFSKEQGKKNDEKGLNKEREIPVTVMSKIYLI